MANKDGTGKDGIGFQERGIHGVTSDGHNQVAAIDASAHTLDAEVLRTETQRLSRESDGQFREAVYLTNKASDLNLTVSRLNQQGRDMFTMCNLSMEAVQTLRDEANLLRNEAESLLEEVNVLYNQAGHIHLDANKLYVVVMQLHNDATKLMLEHDAMQNSVAYTRAEVSRLHSNANQVNSDVVRLHIDAGILHAQAHQTGSAARLKLTSATVKDAASDDKFEDVKHWYSEVARLQFEANQATTEAEFLYEKAGEAFHRGAGIREENRLLQEHAAIDRG